MVLQAHNKADLDAPLHPAVLLGAKVLPHKGGDGNAESAHHHPDKPSILPMAALKGDGVRAKGVDAGLHHQVGDRVQHRLRPPQVSGRMRMTLRRMPRSRRDLADLHPVGLLRA